MNDEILYAEDVGNYFKTSKRTTAAAWLNQTKALIVKAGGELLGDGYGNDYISGRCAYMIAFRFGPQKFKITWPVLPSRTGNVNAAKIQAVTMMCHEIKARCVSLKVKGARAAFFAYFLLPDGSSIEEKGSPELMLLMPTLNLLPDGLAEQPVTRK